MGIFERLRSRIKRIESFESLRFTVSGMRHFDRYEAVCGGETTEISLFFKPYDEGDPGSPERSNTVKTSDFLELLNGCGVGKWNGFSGPNPRGIKDGTMFSLTASVNGGTKLYAHGSNNFPKNFREFRDGIKRLLGGENN